MYYISRNYRSIFNAAGKAKTDCEYSLEQLDFKNLGFNQSSIASSAKGTIKNVFGISLALMRLPFKSILCTQYPNNKFRNYIMAIARLKKSKVITIVHDIRFLKGRHNKLEKELNSITKGSSVLIVHNSAMCQWLKEKGVKTPIVVLGVFDYVSKEMPQNNIDSRKRGGKFDIAYAGGLSYGKNSYLFELDLLRNDCFQMNLYGMGYNASSLKVDENKSIIKYHGAFPSEQVAFKIKADFGLVWDGVSTEECSGALGQYLRYNNPHKTSLYLLCGLPIIVWKEAAISRFIVKNNLGIAIGNLKDLNKVLSNLTEDEYQEMKNNVLDVQGKVQQGEFMISALKKALSYC